MLLLKLKFCVVLIFSISSFRCVAQVIDNREKKQNYCAIEHIRDTPQASSKAVIRQMGGGSLHNMGGIQQNFHFHGNIIYLPLS
ncbi:hypothetical protein JHK85_008946 [Glycine max]|uniref:Uncharacterized protein n=2 Tax=Glycine subgen. Soja TaxID=1462606 RepID=A0A0R0K667_SOYBN|nr:hypothetical protein JHK85_008946 [Glycine max]KAG5064975.1 hypothetical protein JHK86_008706 [Glycine max]KAH1109189.1 hypothetical protein GYH30_008542 [Glycine max]RZC14386.1 hypothetical protein D0Y65_008398 [Glycine soja]